jgi:hypothetical protein
MGAEACARAKLSTTDPSVASATCETARAQAEKAAWVEIERAASKGEQPVLVLDNLVHGLPKAPTAPPPSTLASSVHSSRPDAATAPSAPAAVLDPAQAASASIAGNTLSVPATNSNETTQEESPSSSAGSAWGSTAYLDARNGFRDMKFGDPPKSDMILIENDGKQKFYHRKSDDLTVGVGELSEITYGFYKQQLYIVWLKTRGLPDSQALLTTLTSAYGAGQQSNEYLEEYVWNGSVVTAIYEQNQINGSASTVISSIGISAQKAGDEKAAAARSAGNL